MDIYAQVIGDDATPDALKAIAAHFEKQGDMLGAGRAWLRAGENTTVGYGGVWRGYEGV